jgi:hypothetical protein
MARWRRLHHSRQRAGGGRPAPWTRRTFLGAILPHLPADTGASEACKGVHRLRHHRRSPDASQAVVRCRLVAMCEPAQGRKYVADFNPKGWLAGRRAPGQGHPGGSSAPSPLGRDDNPRPAAVRDVTPANDGVRQGRALDDWAARRYNAWFRWAPSSARCRTQKAATELLRGYLGKSPAYARGRCETSPGWGRSPLPLPGLD